MADQSLNLIIRATDLASAQLAAIRTQVDNLGSSSKNTTGQTQSLGKSLSSISDNALQLGHSMTNFVTLPIVGVAAAAIKTASDFQTQMHIMQNETGITAAQAAQLQTAILQLGTQGSAGPIELAKAMYHPVSAGFDMVDSINMVKVAQQESMISGSNLEDTVNALTGAMYSQVKGATNAHDTMATLNAIIGAGNMRMQDLNGAMGTGFLSTAQTFGVSLQDMGGAMDVMVDRGMTAESAATRLRMAITLMAAPSKQATGMLQDLGLGSKDAQDATNSFAQALTKAGVSSTQLATDMRTKGFDGALHDLQDHLTATGMSSSEVAATMSRAFGGAKSATSIELLTANLGSYDQKLKTINGTQGEFDKSAADASQTFQNQFGTAVSKVQVALVKLGTTALPGVSKAMKDISSDIVGVINWFTNLSPKTQDFIVKAAVMVAVIGPVLIVLGTLGKSIMNIVKVAQGVDQAFKWAFIAEKGQAFSRFGGLIRGAGGMIKSAIGGISAAFDFLAANPIVIVIAIIVIAVAALAFVIVKYHKQIWDTITGVWNAIAKFFTSVWDNIKKPVEDGMKAIAQVISTVFTVIVKAVEMYVNLITLPWRIAFALALAIVIVVLKLLFAVISAVFTAIWAFLGPILDTIWKGIVAVWNAIYSTISTVVNAVWGVIKTVFTAVWNTISTISNAIWQFLVTVWTSVYNSIVSALRAAYNFIASIFNAIVGAVSGPIGQVINVVKGVGGQIINALAGAGSWLVNAGKNIIIGLWNGIAGMAGWLYNQIMGFIKANVPGPVLKILHIGSPSKLFEGYGTNTMQGFHQGFMGQADQTTKTVSTVFNGLVKQSQNTLASAATNMKQMTSMASSIGGKIGASMAGGVSSGMSGSGVTGPAGNIQNNKSFAPVININNYSGKQDNSYTANKTVAQMQYGALFQ